MHASYTKLTLSLLLAGFAGAALAQPIVPPPAPLGETPKAAASTVIPATTVSGLPGSTPASAPSAAAIAAGYGAPPAPAAVAASAPPVTLQSLTLPPPPPRPSDENLTPAKPAAAAPVAKPAAKPGKKPVAAEKAPDVELDPFAGVVGTPVSDSQLNRFVYPEPVEGVYFPEGAPLPECPENAGPQDPCKPVFLNGRRMMLLQLRAGAKGPIQMLTHLTSGRIVTINLAPARGPGAVVRVDGAEDGPSDARMAAAGATSQHAQPSSGAADSEANVALLSRFARGDIPGGFEPIRVASPTRFELFDVIPMATWSNGSTLKAHLMQVRALGTAPVAIKTSLFRTPAVKALALDHETITDKQPAMLYLLEQVETR